MINLDFWTQIAVGLVLLGLVFIAAVLLLRVLVKQAAQYPSRSTIIAALESEARILIRFSEAEIKAELIAVKNNINGIDVSKWSTAWYNALPDKVPFYGISIPIGLIKRYVTADQWRLIVLHCIQSTSSFIDEEVSLLDKLTGTVAPPPATDALNDFAQRLAVAIQKGSTTGISTADSGQTVIVNTVAPVATEPK